MPHRTTFALDSATAARLKRLAATWRMSQAEVVRRAVAQAESAVAAAKRDPIAALKKLHAAGQGLDPRVAATYLAQVRAGRKQWRSK